MHYNNKDKSKQKAEDAAGHKDKDEQQLGKMSQFTETAAKYVQA